MVKHIARHRTPTQNHLARAAGVGLAASGVLAASALPAQAQGFATPSPVPASFVGTAMQKSWTPSISSGQVPIEWSSVPIQDQAPTLSYAPETIPSTPAPQNLPTAQETPIAGTQSEPSVQDASNVESVLPQEETTADVDSLAVQPAAQVTGTHQSFNSTTDPASGTRQQVLEHAMEGLGGAYVWGGHSFKAWDCSGFVSYVYAQSGISLNPYTYSMVTQLAPVTTPQPGDIVFTDGFSHVGIYLGNGQMISAMNPSQGTMISSVDGGGMMTVDGYYSAPGI